MKILLPMVILLSGCEALGLQGHQGDIARFKYANGECKVELWQSGLELLEAEKFTFGESISVDAECNVSVEYSESDNNR